MIFTIIINLEDDGMRQEELDSDELNDWLHQLSDDIGAMVDNAVEDSPYADRIGINHLTTRGE